MDYSCINTAKDSFQEIEEKIKIQKIKRELRKFSLGHIFKSWLSPHLGKCNRENKEEFIYEFDDKNNDYALFLVRTEENPSLYALLNPSLYTVNKNPNEKPSLYTVSKNPDDLVEDFFKYLSCYEERHPRMPVYRNWEIETECLLFSQISRSMKQKLNYFILHKYESLFQKI